MHKSIFIKYFTVFTSLIITCICIMGVCFVYISFDEIMDDEHDKLFDSLSRGFEIIYSNYDYENQFHETTATFRYFDSVYKTSSTLFILVNTNNEIIYSSNRAISSYDNIKAIDDSIVNLILKNGKYAEYGTLGEIYDVRVATVGLPIYIDDVVVGYVFATCEEYLNDETFLYSILKIFLFCAFVALIVSFVAVYFITHQMVKPLRDMSEASKRFAVGDFSQKINVTSVDEIGQLALAMNNMAQALEVSENAHKSFVANVSHELRTPMTSISGFVDGILDGTIPKEKEVHYLNIVSDEVKRLSRLVRTMLNLSRIENKELVLETARINVIDIICETLFSFEREIERKNIRLEGIDHEKVYVMIDYDLIHQVIYNLIENAVKFVDDGGYIRFTYTAQTDSTIIGIENSGPGLSKDEIPKIFERFYKTDSSRGVDKNGVGLGLHIVRSIVNLHQGEVMVQSVEGKYCKFSFNLPNVKYDMNF